MTDFYVGTYTREFATGRPTGSQGIYLCGLDDAGHAQIRQSFSKTENPSFLAWEPRRRLLAAASEQLAESSVDLYQAAPDGSLTLLDRLYTHGVACCHVAFSPDGRFLAGVHYGSGEVFAAAVSSDGHFGRRLTLFRHSGHGPDPRRQEGPHPHSVQFVQGANRAFVCDLGIDRIVPYEMDGDTGLRPAASPPFEAPGGSGPRHMALTRDGQWMYVACELGNMVLACSMQGGMPRLCQSLPTLPADFRGPNLAADIHLSLDESRLYVSNRGHDSLAEYAVGPDHLLAFARHIPCCGRGPRNFSILEPYILCANQDSDEITILQNASLMGRLQIPSPVCIAAV